MNTEQLAQIVAVKKYNPKNSNDGTVIVKIYRQNLQPNLVTVNTMLSCTSRQG